MSTLISIPNGHMRFVPAEKPNGRPFDGAQAGLIASRARPYCKRHGTGDNKWIRTILSPTIQAICRLKPKETTFFPPPLHPRCTTTFRTPACPKRSLPHSPAIGAMIPHMGPSTSHRGPRPDFPSSTAFTCLAPGPPHPRWKRHEGDTHQHSLYPISTASHP